MSERLAIVCGAGGLVGGHLVAQLVEDGYRVRAADQQYPYGQTPAHERLVADLRDVDDCRRVFDGGADEVYQLAADMGGMEFISSRESDIMRNNALVNLNVLDTAARAGVDRYFFSSSVCVYRDMVIGEDVIDEDAAYPARPDNEYGWEKLYAERAVAAYSREFGFAPRVARFENCYGPHGAWRGGREKAPAALSRKVAEAADPGSIEVFGGGRTVRSFVYVKDLVRAVRCLVDSAETRPTNIGVDETVTIAELVALIADVAGKQISIVDVPGPLGVQSRNFSHERIQALGWKPEHTLRAGLEETYAWVEAQVRATAGRS
ncbi:MAG: NAD-dependent epimerase/dehydratase family protein [Acidimicrobiales bacterium]